jgi:hypothetical protein
LAGVASPHSFSIIILSIVKNHISIILHSKIDSISMVTSIGSPDSFVVMGTANRLVRSATWYYR